MTYDNYRKAWDHAGQGHTPDVPIHVDIELSSVCNLKCPMCPQVELPHSSKSFIDTNLVKKIIDECQALGVLSIKLNWRGESTLHPQFEEIARYTKGKFVDVMLNTNGMYSLFKNKTIRECFTTVVFSFDSFYPEVLNKIRSGADVDRIKLNILKLRNSRVKLKINHTRQKANWGELSAIEKYCKNRCIELNVRVMYPRTDYDIDFVKDRVEIVGRKNCGYPFQRLVIAHDGKVFPCCVMWDGEGAIGKITYNEWEESLNSNQKESIGNLGRDNLKTLWHSDRISLLRSLLRFNVHIEPHCKKCTSWNSYVVQEK